MVREGCICTGPATAQSGQCTPSRRRSPSLTSSSASADAARMRAWPRPPTRPSKVVRVHCHPERDRPTERSTQRSRRVVAKPQVATFPLLLVPCREQKVLSRRGRPREDPEKRVGVRVSARRDDSHALANRPGALVEQPGERSAPAGPARSWIVILPAGEAFAVDLQIRSAAADRWIETETPGRRPRARGLISEPVMNWHPVRRLFCSPGLPGAAPARCRGWARSGGWCR